MEKHKCKLCLKTFANGRALGGHMRSHMFNLYVTPKSLQPQSPVPPYSPSSPEDEGDDHQEDSDGYGLIENPKKSIGLADQESSFARAVTVTSTATAVGGAGSVVLQDRESETESLRNATVRRRSKRVRIPEASLLGDQRHFQELDRNGKSEPTFVKPSRKTAESSWVDPEPVSSISDTTPEEDVAYCLMMLSRDKWILEYQNPEEPDEEEEQQEEHEDSHNKPESESESEREILEVKRTPARTKYRCETCGKVFRSYQSLGGHRASHKKIKLSHHNNNHETQNASVEEKTHECPVCFKVFASGQALGGHKRSHVTASTAAMAAAKPVSKQSIALIDLNLPAPVDDDVETSQIELSAVSDGEFVKPH